MRAVQWLLGLIDVRAPHLELEPPSGTRVKVIVPPYRQAASGLSTTRLVLTVSGALVAVAGSLAVVLFALRRLRRPAASDDAVVEEREALGSLRGAAGAAATGLGRRLRRRFSGLGRREARSPGELVRLRYAQLERRLAASGKARPPGVTVRDHLAACAAAMEAPPPWPMSPASTSPRGTRRTPSMRPRRNGSKSWRAPSGRDAGGRVRGAPGGD